jgi:hypothetical protein
MIIVREENSTRAKPTEMSLSSPQIPYILTYFKTQAAAERRKPASNRQTMAEFMSALLRESDEKIITNVE